MNKLKSNTGLTLIEIIISVAILAIVSMTMLSVFANGFMHIKNAGEDTSLLYDAQEDIETVIATDGAGIPATLTFTFPDDSFDISGVVVEDDSLVSFLPGVSSIINYVNAFTLSPDTINLTSSGEVSIITPYMEGVNILEDPTNMDIIWSSSNNNIATVTDGQVKAVANGSVFITGIPEGRASGSTLKDTVVVNVSILSSIATLSNVVIDGTTLPGFASDIFSYTGITNPGTLVISDISITFSDTSATVTYNLPDDLSHHLASKRVLNIIVTAEDGSKETYTIQFDEL